MERGRINGGDAMQRVGIGLQGVLAAADRLNGASLEGLDQFNGIAADELTGSVVMLTNETRFLVSAHGQDAESTSCHDRYSARPAVLCNPARTLTFDEPLLRQNLLQLFGRNLRFPSGRN